MLTRSSLLSLLLVVAIGLVVTKIYWLWMSGPWDLPSPGKTKSAASVADGKTVTNTPPLVGTETIISKNIFDPERGAGLTRETEANSQAFQRIRSMVLLGTAILGNNRFAIVQEGISPGVPRTPGQPVGPMRVKLGDTVEGFKLSEISEKRIVFTRGAAKVEVPLDYFRKIDGAQPRASATAQTSPSEEPTVAPETVAPPRVVTPGQTNAPPPRVPRPPRRDREPAAGE